MKYSVEPGLVVDKDFSELGHLAEIWEAVWPTVAGDIPMTSSDGLVTTATMPTDEFALLIESRAALRQYHIARIAYQEARSKIVHADTELGRVASELAAYYDQREEERET